MTTSSTNNNNNNSSSDDHPIPSQMMDVDLESGTTNDSSSLSLGNIQPPPTAAARRTSSGGFVAMLRTSLTRRLSSSVRDDVVESSTVVASKHANDENDDEDDDDKTVHSDSSSSSSSDDEDGDVETPTVPPTTSTTMGQVGHDSMPSTPVQQAPKSTITVDDDEGNPSKKKCIVHSLVVGFVVLALIVGLSVGLTLTNKNNNNDNNNSNNIFDDAATVANGDPTAAPTPSSGDAVFPPFNFVDPNQPSTTPEEESVATTTTPTSTCVPVEHCSVNPSSSTYSFGNDVDRWECLIGYDSNVAEKLLATHYPNGQYNIHVVPDLSPITMDLRYDRIRIFTNDDGCVAKAPYVG